MSERPPTDEPHPEDLSVPDEGAQAALPDADAPGAGGGEVSHADAPPAETPRPPPGAPRQRGRLERIAFWWLHPGSSRYIGLICLGLMLDVLALPPGPLPILILAADLPFLWLLFRDEGRRWKRWAFAYGFLHFALALRWLFEVHPAQILAVGVILGSVYIFLGAAIRFLASRRLAFPLCVGICVVLEELLRTVWIGGMPWPARSLSFAGPEPAFGPALNNLVPATAVFGAYGLSFLAGATSGLLYLATRLIGNAQSRPARAWRSFAGAALIPLAVLLLLMGTAMARSAEFSAEKSSGGVYASERELAVVQGDISQSLKHSYEKGAMLRMFDLHLSLSAQAVRQVGADQLIGLLWPETMITYDFLDPELAARFPEDWDNQIGVIKRMRHDVPEAQDLDWLVGAIHQFRRGQESHSNLWRYGSHDSLFHVRPRGAPLMYEPNPRPPAAGEKPAWEVPGPSRHDKVALVPGGEYTPLGEILVPLRWLRNLVSPIPELERGAEDQEPFRLRDPDRPDGGEIRAGTVICFELAFPARCRAWRKAGAEVLLNAANYGWFGPTGFRDQIQAIASLRAAELGVTVVMAGNTGPSAFFDPLGRRYGRFWAPSDGGEGLAAGTPATTHRPGWARGRLYADPNSTSYARFGDGPWLLLGLLVLLGAGALGKRKRAL